MAIVAAPFAAHAQTVPRLLVSVGAGAQVTGDAVSDRREFELNAETAVSDARHPFTAGGLFDGGISVRLWRQLAAGVSISYFSASAATGVEARIPHPFQFNAYREISGTISAADRSETAVHAQVLYHLPLHGKLRAALFAGPSFIRGTHDVVREVRYDEAFPYDTATFAGADVSRASGSGVGFNAGADLFWMLTERFGAGALLRFTRASFELDGPANRQIPFDPGGVHIAIGARATF
jgi:hypothetical protein